ncbi:hypothetical protein ANHYDRO_01379 [Anaerococcus hydrogenalis DSM 7454]|uniref:Uncharacterized protein n=2 Tax=Anaerococcus hydrogenalis TaxID=33029 RepID=B6W9V3_9FIRM|nr:hypothetical protein ANHYDRO_01379 [Anaerococcus hydrogenalis DSM 7454]
MDKKKGGGMECILISLIISLIISSFSAYLVVKNNLKLLKKLDRDNKEFLNDIKDLTLDVVRNYLKDRYQ